MKKNIAIKLILFLAAFGIIVSVYALAHHFELAKGEFCSISDVLDCDKVDRSVYSEIFGVPVALLGIIFYVSIFVLALIKFLRPVMGATEDFYQKALFYLSAIGLLFTLYLNFVEAFFIKSFCLVCLISFAAVIGIFAIVFIGLENE
ncbi:MAG: vitamin K epoxide reductase family protein [Patescibacteria group bacterium]